MTVPVFDGEGNITNSADMTAEEVAESYRIKNQEVFARAKAAEDKEKLEKERADKAQQDLDAIKASANQGSNEELGKVKDTVASLELAERKRQFGYDNGLSPEETDAVFKFQPNPTKETLADPFLTGGLGAIRAKKKLEANTPGSSTTSPVFGGKKFDDLSPAEKQANFGEHLASKKPRK